jgi:Mlc titration factor MtfA (ptsG expression regulator)
VIGTFRRWREAQILRRRPIPDALWRDTLARYPFIAARVSSDLDELRRLATLFLARKQFHGAGGFEVTDAVAVAIAAQACLPVLHLGLDWYDGFVGIVVHEDEVRARRQVMDEDGVVHEYDEWLTGEAMEGGPLMLSWHDVRDAGNTAEMGYNVVIHEFAHVIDMRDGLADGIPPLPDRAARGAWASMLEREIGRLEQRLDQIGRASCRERVS